MRNPFRRKATDTATAPITVDGPYLPSPEIEGVELSVSTRRLAALFVENGWTFSLDGDSRPTQEATPESVVLIISGLLETLCFDPEATAAYGYRLLALRDEESLGDTGSVELYLSIGRADISVPEAKEVVFSE